MFYFSLFFLYNFVFSCISLVLYLRRHPVEDSPKCRGAPPAVRGVDTGGHCRPGDAGGDIEYFNWILFVLYLHWILLSYLFTWFDRAIFYSRQLVACSEIVGRRCSRWPPTDLTKSRIFCQAPGDIWKKGRLEESQTSIFFSFLVEWGREQNKINAWCQYKIRKQENSLSKYDKAGHCVPIDQNVIEIFSIWKTLEKFKLDERYWIFTRVMSRAMGLKGRYSNKGLKQKWQWSPASSLYKAQNGKGQRPTWRRL